MRRVFAIDWRWDDAADVGFMKFRCPRCGEEFWDKMTMRNAPRVYKISIVDGKPKRTSKPQRFSKMVVERFAHYWGKTNGGCNFDRHKCKEGK